MKKITPGSARATPDAAQPEHHAALVLLEDPDREREPHEHDEHHAIRT